jgi:hypothetical protein
MVQVHYGEGLAIHTGPEPCVGSREGVGEASAGEATGQPCAASWCPKAPAGIEREQFARVSIKTRAGAVPAIAPKVA